MGCALSLDAIVTNAGDGASHIIHHGKMMRAMQVSNRAHANDGAPMPVRARHAFRAVRYGGATNTSFGRAPLSIMRWAALCQR